MLEESRRGEVNWEEFKAVFNEKYFLETYKEGRQDELFHLEQGERGHRVCKEVYGVG